MFCAILVLRLIWCFTGMLLSTCIFNIVLNFWNTARGKRTREGKGWRDTKVENRVMSQSTSLNLKICLHILNIFAQIWSVGSRALGWLPRLHWSAGCSWLVERLPGSNAALFPISCLNSGCFLGPMKTGDMSPSLALGPLKVCIIQKPFHIPTLKKLLEFLHQLFHRDSYEKWLISCPSAAEAPLILVFCLSGDGLWI